MLLYTILVTRSLFDSQNAKSAFLFSQSIMKTTNNSINSIFFYSDGVFNGRKIAKKVVNGISLVDCWYNFSKEFSVNLYICCTAAKTRGIRSQDFEQQVGVSSENNHFGFKLVGLGKLAYAILHSDRLLQF